MTKKDILELKRRMKKEACTFTKLCGCYVDGNKNIILKINETFLNLKDEEFFKYLDIAKKALSGTIGNNLLELEFAPVGEGEDSMQSFLLGMRDSKLKNEALLDRLYEKIIEKYDYTGNYLILLFHDAYDVVIKTSDNNKLDESEEVYEYIICAICPMILSKPGLGYNKSDMRIGTLNREWMVGMPETGFIFPAFNERSSDIHSVLMYTADSKNPHNELIQDILGCREKLTFVQKQNVLCDMVSDVTSEDDLKEVMESVNIELAQISDSEPETVVNEENIKSALTYAGIEENKADKIGKEYITAIDKDELPLLGDIIPNKAVKAVKDNNEKVLLKEEIKELNRKIAQAYDTEGSDIIIKVNDEKRELIRQEDIDGETYLVIPISQNDSIKIN